MIHQSDRNNYTTSELIDDLQRGIGNLLFDDEDSPVSIRRIDQYIGRYKGYISRIKYKIHNPNAPHRNWFFE